MTLTIIKSRNSGIDELAALQIRSIIDSLKGHWKFKFIFRASRDPISKIVLKRIIGMFIMSNCSVIRYASYFFEAAVSTVGLGMLLNETTSPVCTFGRKIYHLIVIL